MGPNKFNNKLLKHDLKTDLFPSPYFEDKQIVLGVISFSLSHYKTPLLRSDHFPPKTLKREANQFNR